MRTRSQKAQTFDTKEQETVPVDKCNDDAANVPLHAQKVRPYRILQHTNEVFAVTVMTVVIVLSGGTTREDLQKVKVNKLLILISCLILIY